MTSSDDSEKLTWGILSTARISTDVIPGLQRSAINRLTAVASRNIDTARAFAEANAIPHAFGSYEALLDDPDIQCVYIPLPNHLHAQWTQRAVLAGKHVLCEKPFVNDAQEATRLFTLADLRGVHLAEAFMYRYHPRTHALKEIVTSGALGTIHTIRAWFTYSAEESASDIRFQPGMEGGALRDVGSYPVSLCNYLLDAEPDLVNVSQVLNDNGIDERSYGTMHYPNKVVAMFDCSMTSHPGYGVTVIGSAATAMLACPWYSHKLPAHIVVTSVDGERHVTPDGAENPYFLETENFARVVRGDAEPELSADETVRTVRTLARLQQASVAVVSSSRASSVDNH